ncbi:SurA N-terminal domain-containing protein [Ferrigenium sp. UT5]|uniref:SurA N-terminal domain-containing protein n=1 Tax=Ferrigenium sp. UT5 TaxID=3242105 RepID=UPI00354D6FC4
MFDFVHERKRLVQIVLALIILPFALWGLDSYQHSGDTGALATVNGTKIGQAEFEDAMVRQRERLREVLGENLDPAMFDSAEMKRSVLQGLVTQHLLLDEARAAGLVVSDEQMARLIAGVPAFQKDGVFDKSAYEAALRAQGMNPALFEYRVRQDILSRQLTDALAQNGYAADATAENLIRLNEQQRRVSVAKLDLAAFRNEVRVEDAEVKAFYAANQQQFQLPERAQVEYVTLSVADLSARVAVSAGEVEQYYREHAAEFGTAEQRRAAHILVGVAKNASSADRDAARSKADSLLQQVRQKPANFAALAKQYSDDPGSAANGGDLGLFGRGMMVKPFDDAVFGLKVGEISGLVQTDFGFHIIRLTAIQPGKTKPLAEVKAQIEQAIRLEKANNRFAELAEQFSNIVYEQSDTLKPAAELIGATVQGGLWLTRGQQPAGLWTDKMLQAVFAPETLNEKRNTSAVEVAANTLLAARVTEHRVASTRPLPEVAAQIRRQLQDQAGLQAAAKQGAALMAQLQNGEKVSVKWDKAQTVARAQQSELNPALARKILTADASKLPAYVAVEDAQQGYLIARIEAVKEIAGIEPMKREGYAQQVRQMTGEALLQAYLEEAKARADIEIKDFAPVEKQ